MTDSPLWQPASQRIDAANVTHFAARAADRWGRDFSTGYNALHTWSVEQPEEFWQSVWDDCGVVSSVAPQAVLENAQAMPGARWFPGSRLNYAENLLRSDDATTDAMVFRDETGATRRLSHAQLSTAVAQVAAALRADGVVAGDRVAGYLPNMPETIIAMLGAASIGAIWSSCSPDFGVQGVLDRFGQIEPVVFITVDAYFYNGKVVDSGAKSIEILASLPSVKRVVTVEFAGSGTVPEGATSWSSWLSPHEGATHSYAQLPFDHPLFIMFSSGTTGVPKCIVHGAGGTLLKHLVEHQLHSDVKSGDRLFYFTTCGWMMWNWLVTGLASGATLMLYDGSPFYPGPTAMFDFLEAESISIFGTSAKFIDACAKADVQPERTHDLSALKTILSTGSPLVPESFDYVYSSVKGGVCLSSISGGTDIVGCFVLGNPTLPVWRGEIQCMGLGMAVAALGDDGEPVATNEKGELSCLKPFPSMPVAFWNDPDGSRYHDAYFARFDNVWCHGDYVSMTEHGGMMIYGRSDAVLNPGGVRIGTAEIYRQVERVDEVVESIVIGQNWEGDTRVVLFVVLREGLVLDDALRDQIRTTVRANATPRHVPAVIIQVADIPRTRSGKIVELAVRNVVHGEPVQNVEALSNPDALAFFANCPELATD